jgi:hypothetical protein
MDPLQAYILDKVLMAAVVILSIYFVGYFREKGRNLATKEDIEEITKRTKQIEANISGDLWVRQRKRELQLEIINKMNELLSGFLVRELRQPRPAPYYELSATDELLVGPSKSSREETVEAIEKWKEYEKEKEKFSMNWFALRGIVKALFSEQAIAAFTELDPFISSDMREKPVPDFANCRDKAIKILLEEACA